MKKVLSLVLALLMAVSTASMAFAAETADTAITEEAPKLISAADTYAEAIGMLDAYGIMKGVDPNTFNADADSDIQRYQMALFVGRISTGRTDDAQWTDGNVNNSGFTDLDGTPAQNFYGAISYASQKGIIEGYGDGKFGPTDGITYRDALTMVCRTLGYTFPKYPWPYIEKAEAIGLTKGITGVAYTDILNRGEVAQIIYNALSIPTAAGDTLGARYFGADLAWKTIIITVTDGAVIDQVSKDFVSKNSIPKDTVGFRVVKADGDLEDTTYFIAKEKLGINKEDKHADEAQLGAAYKLLFTDDGSKLVKSLGEQKIFLGTTKNEGLFSKDADGKYPIEKALANLSLVGKYGKVNYVNVNSWNDGEIIIYNALGTPVDVTPISKRYAIDWNNGNILERNDKGDIVVVDNTGKEPVEIKYSVAWYYNELLGKYFRYKFNATGTTVKFAGIDILDDVSELGDLTIGGSVIGGLVKLNNDNIKKNTAYAKLDLYDTDTNGVADYGLYTGYRFGQYTTGKLKDADGNEKDGNPIMKELNVAAATAWAIGNGKTVADYSDYSGKTTEILLENYKGGKGYITGATPANGDYVIYSYNALTGELHIEKIVDKDASDKTYIATGLVRAYDVNKRSVTIGNDTLYFDYADLAGNPMFYDGDNVYAKAVYGAILNDYFMNFVNYVVVDGKLVYISSNATNGTKYIVVDSYAGISADGYIVVNGYRSDALKYEQIRIGAYDQWLKGDLYNYAYKYDMNDLFDKQSVYKVTSYDAANDAYYVESNVKLTGTLTTWEWKDGYKSNDGFKTESRAKADDTYILILDEKLADDLGYAPVQVYTGKAANGSAFTGEKIADTNIFVNVDPTSLKGTFATLSRYALTYGLLISADYNTAKYVSANEADGKLLLGATYYDATVLDLYTGKLVDVKVLNKDITKGLVYPVINGQIVARNGYNETGFGAKEVEITGAAVTLLEDARPSWGYYDGTLTANEIFNKDKELSIKLTGHKDNFATLKVFNVTTAGDLITATEITKASQLPGDEDVKNYKTFVIYGWKGAAEGDNSFAIVYVIGSGEAKTVGEGKDIDTTKIHQVVDGGYITGSVNAAVTTKIDAEGNSTSTAAVNSLSFWFIGAQSKVNHKEVADLDLYFGDAGLCTEESWQSTFDGKKTFNGSITDAVYGSIKDDKYSAHGDDGEDCNLVYKVTIDVSDLKVTVDENVEAKAATETEPAVAAKDNSKKVDVVFTGYKDVDGKRTANKYTANVTISLEKGVVKYVINSIKNGEKTYDAIDLTKEAEAAKVIY